MKGIILAGGSLLGAIRSHHSALEDATQPPVAHYSKRLTSSSRAPQPI
jgi:hypothetical protein